MRRKFLTLILLVSMALTAGCGTQQSAPTSTPPAQQLRKVKLALGFIPNVQFASYYVSKAKGYYAEEGLDVEFEHGIVPDLLTLLGKGDQDLNFAAASGDEIIQARVQGVPVKYVMTWYRQYPVAAVAEDTAGKSIKAPADLRGKTIGVPGRFGATYVGLKALLEAGNLTESDVTIKTIGFSQVESLANKQVDAAMVYAANEPVQLRKGGMNVSVIKVSDHKRLASNGLVTNETTAASDPELVRKMVRATLRGIQDTISDPQTAFGIALTMLPDVGKIDKDLQLEVLRETVKLMQAEAGDPASAQPAGWIDREVWDSTQNFLLDAGLIPKKGNIDDMFTNDFLVK